jgi:hypothetical protein
MSRFSCHPLHADLLQLADADAGTYFREFVG